MTFTVAQGERVAVIGKSGAGKTTLISIICGIVKPSSGKVTVDGFDIIDDYKLELQNRLKTKINQEKSNSDIDKLIKVS